MKKLLRELFYKLFYTKYKIELLDGDIFPYEYLYLRHFPSGNSEICYHDDKKEEYYFLKVERTGIVLKNGEIEHYICVIVENDGKDI